MKLASYIVIILVLISCSDYKTREPKESQIHDTLIDEKDIAIKTSEMEYKNFDIERFLIQSDSLLKKLKGEQYSFEITSDTFEYSVDNIESFTQGHGLFWDLYKDSIDIVIRHCLFEPNTKKMLRIYLVEAYFFNEVDLRSKIFEFETTINDSMPDGFDSYDFERLRLTPLHDYIMTGEKKLYWLNAGYPYSNAEFYKFIDCIKNNVDTTLYKGKILCLFGSDCIKQNVP